MLKLFDTRRNVNEVGMSQSTLAIILLCFIRQDLAFLYFEQVYYLTYQRVIKSCVSKEFF